MFSAFQTFGKLGAPAGRTLAQQIAAMLPKLWLEPSVAGGYQDSAGTTALYQPGAGSADPPVGKVIDLSGNGNHASQATSTARPKLSGRVNLLTYTEDFSNGVWGSTCSCTPNDIPAPSGGMASKLTRIAVGPMSQTATVYSAQIVFRFTTKEGTRTAAPFLYNPTQGAAVSWTAETTDAGLGFLTYKLTSTSGINPGDSIWAYIFAGGQADGTYIWVDQKSIQLEVGSTATAYQAVVDANTYNTAGWPLIHQFDAVDDVYTSTFGSSLGSGCTVVTANRGAAPTILTGQTIGTSLAINATHAGKLVFDRALTAAETAIVTKWATQKGALPA